MPTKCCVRARHSRKSSRYVTTGSPDPRCWLNLTQPRPCRRQQIPSSYPFRQGSCRNISGRDVLQSSPTTSSDPSSKSVAQLMDLAKNWHGSVRGSTESIPRTDAVMGTGAGRGPRRILRRKSRLKRGQGGGRLRHLQVRGHQ
jgi:hypothetical protein